MTFSMNGKRVELDTYKDTINLIRIQIERNNDYEQEWKNIKQILGQHDFICEELYS